MPVRRLLLWLGLPAVLAALSLLAIASGGDGPRGDGGTASRDIAAVGPADVAQLGTAGVAQLGTAGVAPAGPLVDPGSPRPKLPRRPSTVLIIMDEFPIDALLGPHGRIDRARYPNFAALAAGSTWFPNATTVYDSTTRAVPEVLDGRLPRRGGNATYRSHPRSIYDLFGERGYRIVSSEEATSICPPRHCPGADRNRPKILPKLRSGRRERLERFIGAIRGGRPGFYVKHVLLPHGPYLFLPSGRQMRSSWHDPVPGMNSPKGFGDRFLTNHNQQRMLLQIGFVDRELGKLFAQMRREGILDTSMIVVTADHGMAFEVGVDSRRTVSRSNVDELAPVPLFVKAPGQRRRRTVRSYVRTIDVAPTIADVLDLKLPYRADGRSAFSRAVRRRRSVRVIERNFSGTITVSARAMARRRRALVRRRLRLFGSGDLGTLYTGIGPNRRLLGRRTEKLRIAPLGTIRAAIVGAALMREVDPGASVLPSQIGGRIRGGRRGATRAVAVAVNGRIEAVGRSFHLRGSRAEGYAVMVPEAAMKPGRNSVEVFEVTRGGAALRLIGRT